MPDTDTTPAPAGSPDPTPRVGTPQPTPKPKPAPKPAKPARKIVTHTKDGPQALDGVGAKTKPTVVIPIRSRASRMVRAVKPKKG